MSAEKSSDSATGYKGLIARWREDGRETVTVPMIAEALGVSPQTVRALAIPDAGIGRIPRHYVDDVEAALRRLADAKAAHEAGKTDTAKAQ